MLPVTALFGLIAIAFASRLSRGHCVGILIFSLAIYPEYLRIPLGLSQMSIPRLVAFVILFRFWPRDEKGFEWKATDYLLIFWYVWTLIANIAVGADFKRVTFLIGNSFDTVMMYFVARVAFKNLNDFRALFPYISISAIWMGFWGIFESVTSGSPYDMFFKHHEWLWIVKEPEYRLGLMRARGSCAHFIAFGVMMALLLGLNWALRGLVGNIFKTLTVAAFAFIGTFSSLSSGPLLTCNLIIILSVFYYYRAVIKTALAGLLIGILCVEFFSNRHFYYLVDHIALNSTTGWYRGKLIDVAFMQWHEYWLFGYGGNNPNHWGHLIDGRKHVDLVNQYIIIAVDGGVLALLAYIGAQATAIKNNIAQFLHLDSGGRILVFGLSVLILATSIAGMSVSFFGPPKILNFIVLGMSLTTYENLKNANTPTVEQPEELPFKVIV